MVNFYVIVLYQSSFKNVTYYFKIYLTYISEIKVTFAKK